jgi:hypothetical protein
MALTANDQLIRSQVRDTDKEIERLLLMIYHELRLNNLLVYTADGRREETKDLRASEAYQRLYTRDDDRQIDWLDL